MLPSYKIDSINISGDYKNDERTPTTNNLPQYSVKNN